MFQELKNQVKPTQSLSISSMSNGYLVNAGCVSLVFTSADTLVAALADYLADPDGFQREHGLGYSGPQMGGGMIGGGVSYPPMASHPNAAQHIPPPMDEAEQMEDGATTEATKNL